MGGRPGTGPRDRGDMAGPSGTVERGATAAASTILDDARITLMGSLIEATGRLTRILGAELERRCGLPLTWYDVLIRLGRSPEQRMTMSEMSTQTLLTSGGVTRLIDRVAEAGYVERQSCPTDRRSVYVALTPAGATKLAEATAVHLEDLDRHLMAPLDPPDRRALQAALDKLRGEGGLCGGA